jgi:protein-tyrosine phosphatase
MRRFAGNLLLVPPTLSQHVALAAMDAVADLEAHVATYARNRSLLTAALAALGIHRIAPPDGAFYLYADVGDLTRDSLAWCLELLEVDSAGTHGYHTGSPPDERAIAAARRRGYDLSTLRARVVEAGDFGLFDVVVAMDEEVYGRLQSIAPRAHAARLALFMEFAPGSGRRDVPDPYYGGAAGFEDVLDLVEEGARGLLASLAARG